MARRLGTSQNQTDNDARLLAIEEELKRRAVANGASTESITRENPTTTTQVSGLRLNTSVIGGVSVTWNAVADSGLSRYEVYVAEDSFFPSTNTTIFNVVGGSTSFLYQQGDPSKTYFFKVRAVSEKGTGLFSATLNSKTGQAQTSNLSEGAAAGVVKGTQVFNGGAGTVLTDGQSLEFGHMSINTTGGPVLLLATIQLTAILETTGTSVTLQIFEDNIEIESFTYGLSIISSNLTMQGGFPGVAIPATPNAGQHTYKFKITNGNPSGDITLVKLKRSLIELRAA